MSIFLTSLCMLFEDVSSTPIMVYGVSLELPLPTAVLIPKAPDLSDTVPPHLPDEPTTELSDTNLWDDILGQACG
jgi:hypothetical protein